LAPSSAPRAAQRDILALLVLSLIWGSSFALVKIAVADIPPLSLAAGRIALGALVLLAVQAVAGPPLADLLRPPAVSRWRQFFILGMLGNGIPFVLIGYGETRIGSGLAAILIGTMPLFTLLFAHLFAVEQGLSRRAWGGIALGFAGLVVLIGPAALTDLRASTGLNAAAQIAIVLAGASYAATAVYGRVLSLAMPVPVVAAGSMTASALVMVPLALVIDRPWQLAPGADAVLAVVALGLGATAFASLVYFRLLRSAGPTFASLVNYLIPAFGFALGVVWLNEPASARELAALALILTAVGLVRAKPAVAQAPVNP
jgi:drug/metabolite transporter (DMT)-like permease